MRLHEWLDGKTGRTNAMAERFKVTKGAVSQWRTNGAPVVYLRAIQEFTEDEVTVDDLLADIEEIRL